MSLNNETFVCVDCETTGLDPKTDRIIEVAVAVFNFNQLLDSFETLVDPLCAISPESMAIHHITQEMVQGKPQIQQVLPQVLKMIGSHTIIGHGIGFDLAILSHAAEQQSIPCHLKNASSLDTLRLARLYGKSPSNSLEVLRQHFNIPQEGAHRAMSDVIVNIEVFKYLSAGYKSKAKLFQALAGPIEMKVMPLGKHKGRLLKEIPVEYLQWAVRKEFDQDLTFSLKTELKRRKQGNGFNQAHHPFSKL